LRQRTNFVILNVSARKLAFVYFDAGGGHRSAADALSSAIRELRRPWETSYLNLQGLLDDTDLIRKLTGFRVQEVYNLLLKKGWTLGAAQLLPILHGLIRLYHGRIVHLLECHWRETQPDLVVSLIPHFNRQLAQSICSALPGTPFVTVLTDLADYPPHFWMEPESEYLVCGTEEAASQALAMGHPPERVFRTSGMIVNPAFYTPSVVNRFEARQSLGLEPRRWTGLVLFGGEGSSLMLKIAQRLDFSDNLQLIFICGRNARLAAELRKAHLRIPVCIEGFTTNVQQYMRLSDFFIGKPGPGSISEALTMGLPVIIQRNSWTLPQERFNAAWIQEKEVGMVVSDFRCIGDAVRNLLDPIRFVSYRANALALHNRAVFEVPEILDHILQKTTGQASAARSYAIRCLKDPLRAEAR
jgi:1,2-diacylglycerol 3-beta-galactosyltransferase